MTVACPKGASVL